MLTHKSIPVLAAAVTLLGSSAPAYAHQIEAPAAGHLAPAPAAVSHPSGSSDLALELAAGGIVVVAGGGLAVWQLRRRPAPTVTKPRTASGS